MLTSDTNTCTDVSVFQVWSATVVRSRSVPGPPTLEDVSPPQTHAPKGKMLGGNHLRKRDVLAEVGDVFPPLTSCQWLQGVGSRGRYRGEPCVKSTGSWQP